MRLIVFASFVRTLFPHLPDHIQRTRSASDVTKVCCVQGARRYCTVSAAPQKAGHTLVSTLLIHELTTA